MFELIKLNPDDITFEYQNKSQTMYFWVENMFTDAIMNQENFTRTLATVDNSRVEDLEQRSSWTHNKTFDINLLMIVPLLKSTYHPINKK